MIRGFGCLDFDYIIIKNKRPVTYIVAYNIGDKKPENCDFHIPEKTFKDWTRANNIFGPIPLSLIAFAEDGIFAKRLSFSWEGEYEKLDDTRVVPPTGFRKL